LKPAAELIKKHATFVAWEAAARQMGVCAERRAERIPANSDLIDFIFNG
jgi:hypothetical protein